MAQHGIYSATNICWRYELTGTEKEIRALMDYDLYMDGYPMKSLLNKGIVMTSSTDYPANDGAPIDIASIIELGVNGTLPTEKTVRMKASEYLTVEEMIEVLTINGAKQFRLEAERGSIEVGKYADFLILTKDITACKKEKIHEAKVDSVYFEGKKVYSLK
jgi:predicted amidohydrolase YtcJ